MLNHCFDIVTALIGDNYSTNQPNATKMRIMFLRYASHHFWLSVQEVISERKEAVNNVRNAVARFCANTESKATSNHSAVCEFSSHTRYTFVYSMLERRVRIRDHVEKRNGMELDNL